MMESNPFDKLEPEAQLNEDHCPSQEAISLSIAVSLKRIADSLDRLGIIPNKLQDIVSSLGLLGR